MLLRYSIASNATYSNLLSDITNYFAGNITAVANLVGAAAANSAIYGSYPSGTYSVANNTTSYTFAKTHSATNTIHYIRLGFDGSTGLTSVSLAQAYTAATDTLINSYQYNLPNPLIVQPFQPVDIVLNNNCIYFNCPAQNIGFGIFDLAQTGITKVFANSMIMGVYSVGPTAPLGVIPYAFNTQTITYSTLSNLTNFTVLPSQFVYNANGNLGILENPVFALSNTNGNTIIAFYGLNSIYTPSFAIRSIYSDSTPTYRYVVGQDANNITYSITIS